jgi:hypothetical protein
MDLSLKPDVDRVNLKSHTNEAFTDNFLKVKLIKR